MHSSVLLSLLPLAMAAPLEDVRAPLHVPRGATGNKYIIKMKPGISCTVGIQSVQPDAAIEFPNLGAFASTLNDEEVEQLRSNPLVEFIEKEGTMSIARSVTQTGAPYGLSRLSSTTTGATSYTYDSSAGAGACVYVIDSGIDTAHPEFEGRASLVANTIDNDPNDAAGHGTHVAGTIASKTYGVAKKTTLFGVKVFDAVGRSDNTIIIAGIDFVLGDFRSKAAQCPKGIVVNMSLGGDISPAVDSAAQALVDAGLAVIVAAGNGTPGTNIAVSVDTVSPARVTSVCTVGAVDSRDRAGTFSNFGAALDVHAAGVAVLSTLPGGRTGLDSGTSMATPHVAGLIAYYLGLDGTTPAKACEYVISTALKGKISSLGPNTKNVLAHIV